MSYSICEIIFGIPLTEELAQIADSRNEDLDIEEGGYFITRYTGGGPSSGYVGVSLIDFDETDGFNDFEQISQIQPTLDQQLQAQEAVSNLPEDYQKAVLPIKRYIIWRTS